MKKQIIISFTLLILSFCAVGQVKNLILYSPELGLKDHKATNSILFAKGYRYNPGNGSMKAQIVPPSPVVNGHIIYDQNPVDTNRAIVTTDTSIVVGTINGSFNVNQIGAAAYTIPIDLPSGVNGMKPNLSLVYSSISGPGIAGYGWQIAGISNISRTGQDKFHDGQTRGVNLDNNDRFVLDGQRLVCTSGNYCSDQSQYRTESESFTRITEYVSGFLYTENFKAETKSGLIYKYGYTDESSQHIGEYRSGLSFYVNSISDLFGNRINYNYIKQNGFVYPSSIDYGPNTVTFFYKERTDVIDTYFKGIFLQQKLLLDKIVISYNDRAIKTYQLIYGQLSQKLYSDNYLQKSVLKEVIEFGIQGSKLNSTIFSYQDPEYLQLWAAAFSTENNILNTNCNPYSGDFNGDGRDEIFAVIKTYDKDGNVQLRNWALLADTTQTGFESMASGNWNITISQVIPTDLNGDGKTDLIIVNVGSTTSYYYSVISNGNSFQTPVLIRSIASIKNLMDIKYRYSADFDGDGINDCLVKKTSGEWYLYSLYDTYLHSDSMKLKYSGSISSWGDINYIGDFDGNGKPDIWVFDSNGYKIYENNGNSFTLLSTGSFCTSNHKFVIGDFNGDGKTDIFIYGTSSQDWLNWKICLSNSKIGPNDSEGFILNQSFAAKKPNLKDDNVYPVDIDGDGRTDIISLSSINNDPYPPRPIQYFFIANQNATDISVQYLEGLDYPMVKDHSYTFGDYNGDKKSDAIELVDSNHYGLCRPGGKTDIYLNFIRDGLGNKATIEYQNLSELNDIYKKSSISCQFPVFTWSGPLSVVKSTHFNFGEATANSNYYEYQGAKIHRQGKGFLCFDKVTVTDHNSGITVENTYEFDPLVYFPALKSSVKRYGNNLISSITNSNVCEYINQQLGQNRYFPYINFSTETNHLTSQSIYHTFFYDEYGNIRDQAKRYSNRSETTHTVNENIVTESKWLLGRATSVTTTFSADGDTIKKTINRVFSPNSNLLFSEVFYPSTVAELTKSYEYYPNGILKKESVIGETIRSTEYQYELDSIRIKKITDPLGLSITKIYNENGWLQSETDYLNNIVSYAYDNFGRQTSQINSDGSASSSKLSWWTQPNDSAVYCLEKTGNDGSFSRVLYDKLDREIRTDFRSLNGNMISSKKNYNLKGQLESSSEPYFSTVTPSQFTYHTFDTYGRPDHIYRFTGSQTAFTYYGNQVKENTDGIEYTKTYNPDGSISEAKDLGGTISYQYYPDGKIKSITLNGKVVASMEYDPAGNQTKLVDKSAGTLVYSYTKFGELKTQTSARNKITTFSYNSEGTIHSKEVPEGITTYTYNDKSQLISINGPGNLSRSQTYDSKGRVQNITETIEGNNYSTTFTYDDKGRLETQTHPSGVVEKNIYDDKSGILKIIKADNQSIWNINQMNARGLDSLVSYGSGGSLNKTFTTDALGLPLRNTVGLIQDDSLSFNPVTGNLNWRKNLKRGLKESFEYDTLFRLRKIAFNQLINKVTFDSIGNILSKTDFSPNYRYGDTLKVYNSLVNYANPQLMDFTSFEKVSWISEEPYRADFIYNTDQERAVMSIKKNGVEFLKRIYAGDRYMKEILNGVTREYTYIGGDAYSAPAVIVKTGGVSTTHFLLRDHLGSITYVIDGSGNPEREYSYDAWGNLRNPQNWNLYPVNSDSTLFGGRGYTGHEHLPWFNLINMNGRLYDPVVGRFLSPDNFLSSTNSTQGLNRYAYCINNPMKYSDPSGNIPPLLLAALIVGCISGGYNAFSHSDQISNGWEALAAFGTGFTAGFIGTFVGGTAGIGYGFIPGAIGAGVGYIYDTNIQSALNTGFFGDPLPTAKQYYTGLGVSMATGGIFSGINAIRTDRNFWTGRINTIEIPKPTPIKKLQEPKAELNKDVLTTKMEQIPGPSEKLVEQQNFTRIEKGDGHTIWVRTEQQGITVLGHYPEYENLANKLGARSFKIPTEIWESMTEAEKWSANQKFLDRMIIRGDKVRIATPLLQVRPGSSYEKELNYLFNRAYTVSPNGLWLNK